MSTTTSFDNLLRSRRLNTALNQVRRASGMGNYWYWITVPELKKGIPISELVCPLRYDGLVRRDFFRFYRANRELYQERPADFIRAARASSYYTWYMSSEMVRCNKHLRGNPAALETSFEERVKRSVQLYERVKQEGFSVEFPLTLKTAEQLLPPTTDREGLPTGKQVAAKYFLADGWHRLALMMELGYRTLEPQFFRVKCFRQFSPFDSTSLLVQALNVSEQEYFQYLSQKYSAPLMFSRRKEFLDFILNQRPQDMDEILSLLRTDGYLDGNA